MQSLILVLHVLVAIFLVTLVLMQHGKGADAGASFGAGASNTVFGSQGSTTILMKITAILAFIFFMTSLGLAYMNAHTKQAKSLVDSISAPNVKDKPGSITPPPVDIPEILKSTAPSNVHRSALPNNHNSKKHNVTKDKKNPSK